MDRFKDQRWPKYNDKESPNEDDDHSLEEEDGGTSEPFGGAKVRRKNSRYREHSGDYLHSSLIDEDSRETRLALLHSHRDTSIRFTDKVLKFTGSGKMKRLIFILTDFAIYLIDPETEAMTRRIALAAVEKITQKTELVQVLVDVTKSASDYELEVLICNRFEYNASTSLVKEVSFEETEGLNEHTHFESI
ncbi:hypothetical protein Bca4012_044571 [Brassica carinata]